MYEQPWFFSAKSETVEWEPLSRLAWNDPPVKMCCVLVTLNGLRFQVIPHVYFSLQKPIDFFVQQSNGYSCGLSCTALLSTAICSMKGVPFPGLHCVGNLLHKNMKWWSRCLVSVHSSLDSTCNLFKKQKPGKTPVCIVRFFKYSHRCGFEADQTSECVPVYLF